MSGHTGLLGTEHDGQNDEGENPYIDTKTGTCTEFQDDAEHHADGGSEDGTDIGNHVEHTRDESNADGVTEIEAGDEPQAEEIDESHTKHFNKQAQKIA